MSIGRICLPPSQIAAASGATWPWSRRASSCSSRTFPFCNQFRFRLVLAHRATNVAPPLWSPGVSDPADYRNVSGTAVADKTLHLPAATVQYLLHLFWRHQEIIEPRPDALVVSHSDPNLAGHPSASPVRTVIAEVNRVVGPVRVQRFCQQNRMRPGDSVNLA